jgi:hypothetical protein
MEVANTNRELIYIRFGTNGRFPDLGGVTECTDFYEELEE